MTTTGLQVSGHITFEQLSVEDKFFLWLAATVAYDKLGDFNQKLKPAMEEIIAKFWDHSDLAAEELGDLNGVTGQMVVWLRHATHKG